jgi:cytochrome c oxidase cbb3-type subunit 4
MDINDLRAVITILACVAFLGIVAWAYSRKRGHEFEAAAMLPFSGEDSGESAAARKQTGEKR